MLGKLAVMIDTTPPLLYPINIRQAQRMMKEKTIEFKTSDNLTGIKSWRATLNGKWALVEYDAIKDLLYYTFDWAPNNPEGKMGGWKKYTFQLEVKDSKGNTAKYKADFVR